MCSYISQLMRLMGMMYCSTLLTGRAWIDCRHWVISNYPFVCMCGAKDQWMVSVCICCMWRGLGLVSAAGPLEHWEHWEKGLWSKTILIRKWTVAPKKLHYLSFSVVFSCWTRGSTHLSTPHISPVHQRPAGLGWRIVMQMVPQASELW